MLPDKKFDLRFAGAHDAIVKLWDVRKIEQPFASMDAAADPQVQPCRCRCTLTAQRLPLLLTCVCAPKGLLPFLRVPCEPCIGADIARTVA